jgi:hypothetical protein
VKELEIKLSLPLDVALQIAATRQLIAWSEANTVPPASSGLPTAADAARECLDTLAGRRSRLVGGEFPAAVFQYWFRTMAWPSIDGSTLAADVIVPSPDDLESLLSELASFLLVASNRSGSADKEGVSRG